MANLILDNVNGITFPDGSVQPSGGVSGKGTNTSMIKVNTASGYGNPSTAIRRFSNITNGVNGCVIQGTDITFSDSSSTGSLFTINTNGVYAITYEGTGGNVNSSIGVSLNTSAPAASILTLSNTERLCVYQFYVTNANGTCSWTGYLPSGSLIRPHDDTLASGTASYYVFTIVRVA